MYTLLTGAKKNVGDFLIVHRCKELLKEHKGMKDYLEFKRWQPLDDELEKINDTKAIILCGGPGYAKDFYPNIASLTKNIKDITIPIIPFGLGWSGKPARNPEDFSFTDESKKALEHIHKNTEMTSCRDVLTEGILNRHGFENVMMTGCPAWYNIDNIGKSFTKNPPTKIVISNAQNKKNYPQNVKLLRKVRQEFPKAELYCAFHRGQSRDAETSIQEALALKGLSVSAKTFGYEVVDVSYDTSKLEQLYEKCDVHIGYRVHGHILSFSMRKPSFLIQEDGRGLGLSKSLGLPDVPAWKSTTVKEIMHYLREEVNNGYPGFSDMGKKLDTHYKTMVDFLSKIPDI